LKLDSLTQTYSQLCVELNSFHRSLRYNNNPQIKAYQHQLQSIYTRHYQSH